MQKAITLAWVVSVVLAVACLDEDPSDDDPAGAGGNSGGRTSGAAGSLDSGGLSATGGVGAAGESAGGSGGSAAGAGDGAGGTWVEGGTAGVAGEPSNGGTTSSGGRSSGGTGASMGGTFVLEGGTSGIAGEAGTVGEPSSGAGGSIGGRSSVGGASSGGALSGGAGNGGTYSGGASNGGAYSGGTFSGGASNGGTYSGGASNGGTYSGGASNGGTYSGGASNGGTYSGGAANGGSTAILTCGNGVLNAGETCDGSQLGSATCTNRGFTAGELKCSADCRAFNTSSCRKVVGIAAGLWHTCVNYNTGAVKCWGYGPTLGLGAKADRGVEVGDMGDALPYVSLPNKVTKIWAGGYATCASLKNKDLVCWGSNTYGVLGLGDINTRGDEPGEMGSALPRVELGTGRYAVEVAIGLVHMCAILDDGSVKCWGDNQHGQIGSGKPGRIGDLPGQMGDALLPVALGTGRKAVQIRAGHLDSCALLDNGAVKCWGYNGQGALGLGHSQNRGNDTGEMGDWLPSVNLGTGKRAVGIVAGGRQNCALLEDGSLKCWGGNDNGELGQGNTTLLGTKAAHMGDALPTVPLGTGRKVISVSGWGEDNGTFCVRLDDNSMKCWGYNWFAECGLGDRENRGDDPAEMGDALPAVRVGTGRRVTSVAGGAEHTCALLDDSSVRCWGEDQNGILGLADGIIPTRIGDAPGEMGDALHVLAL